MKKALFAIALICSLAAVSCTKDDLPANDQEEARPYVLDTRSFSELSAKDVRVTMEEAELYSYWKALGPDFVCLPNNDIDWDHWVSCDQKEIEIKAYPDKDNPDIFIYNYPNNTWEILSADKRTVITLAKGEGKFSMDDENDARVAWVKDMAQEIHILHTYEGEIKNAEERYAMWQEILFWGDEIKKETELTGTYPCRWIKEEIPDLSMATRAAVDTSYHPVPGHYHAIPVQQDPITIEQKSHFISTAWKQTTPFNQYCPVSRGNYVNAKAGSDAVAGAQVVHYMHYNFNTCPEVYKVGYCQAYIEDDPMDWTAMDQFDKSADNWSLFQTSDSTRMASVMIANIGRRMQLNYGLNYTGGNFDDLQYALGSEYGLNSYLVPFDGDVDPYEEIERMAYSRIPSIVHTSYDQNNTQPNTFIIDGYKKEMIQHMVYYVFIPDVFIPDDVFATPVYFTHNTYITSFCMNWGDGYVHSDSEWFVNSSDWHISSLDSSNREAFLDFRQDGSVPGEDVE